MSGPCSEGLWLVPVVLSCFGVISSALGIFLTYQRASYDADRRKFYQQMREAHGFELNLAGEWVSIKSDKWHP